MIHPFDWKGRYNQLHSSFPGWERRPVIGITGNFGSKGCELAEGYYESVLAAGGTPVIIPPYEQTDALLTTLEQVDAIILSGGGDMNPLYMQENPLPQLHDINPKRDLAELLLARCAFDRQIPILGICRGIQMLAYALDGELYQDFAVQQTPLNGRFLKHSQDLDRCYPSHTVNVSPKSLLQSIFNNEMLMVNSFHHQSVKAAGPHLRVCATAPDGVIEAVESTEHKALLGVQWHPETFILRGDRSMLPLFNWLVAEAELFHQAKMVHQRILTLDTHCDTPMFFSKGIHFNQRDPKILVDLHKMTEGHLDATIMVAYLEQKARDEEALKQATLKANYLLRQIEEMVADNRNAVEIAYTPAELYHLKSMGKKAIMLGIENGYAIGKDLSLVEQFRKRGVVYMTLCHNGDNDICDSARGNNEHNGVSPFGQKVIEEMNRVGMMVDLSHASERSFYDAINISKQPIVCSHSSCRALCDVPRNLTDRQLITLAQSGGVAQMTLYSGFLHCNANEATINDFIEHVNHAVKLVGVEHVGIGTDFDGDGGVPGCASASELINVTKRLLAMRYNMDDLEKLWGGNFLRVMRKVQHF